MTNPRQEICDVARHIYERRMTDAAGGNFSVREGDLIYCTPKYAGSRHWWNLEPGMIVVADMQGNQVGGSGEFSREWLMHLRIYQEFEAARAVVHAHAENVMVFASMRRPIPPTSEQTDRWGTIDLCEEWPSHSTELAEAVVRGLRPTAGRLPETSIATLIPRHGVTIATTDLRTGCEVLEGLDQSCHILISQASIEAAEALRR